METKTVERFGLFDAAGQRYDMHWYVQASSAEAARAKLQPALSQTISVMQKTVSVKG